ncbi:MAG: hypothetical protein KC478_10395 [Bacteriovoracaceae bacterium]|nr:hypothetical protein [Bacteriovoracaceae bacterium]
MNHLYLFAPTNVRNEFRTLIDAIREKVATLEDFEPETWKLKRQTVVVLGGDGSLNYFLNLCKKHELDIFPTVLYLAYGTGNDFSRLFEFRDPNIENFELLLNGTVKEIPIAQCNDRLFINVATGGELAKVTEQKDKGAKKTIGKLSYYLDGLKVSMDLKEQLYKVITEQEKEKTIQAFGFIIAQGAFAGGGIKISESKRLHPYLFECAFFKKNGLKELLLTFLEMQKDYSKLKNDSCKFLRVPWIRISSQEEISIKLDGEPYESKELLFKHSERFLPLLVGK